MLKYDEKVFYELEKRYEKTIEKLAYEYAGKRADLVEDLKQEAYIVLMKISSKVDTIENLTSYVETAVRREMFMCLKQYDVIKFSRSQLKQMIELRDYLVGRECGEHQLTDKQIQQKMGIDKVKFAKISVMIGFNQPIKLDSTVENEDGEETEYYDLIGKIDRGYEEVDKKLDGECLAHLLENLKDDYKQIVYMKLEGFNQEQIAKHFGVTQQAISKKTKRIESILRGVK